MKNKGFTLIELLGIILILSIIALITVPTVTKVIENSKKGAVIESANGYKKSVDDFYIKKIADEPDFEFNDDVYLGSELKDLGLKVTGAEPTLDSWVEIRNNKVIDYSLKFDDYVANYDINTNKVVVFKGNIENK